MTILDVHMQTAVKGTRRRRIAAWGAAWLALSVVGTVLHWGSWIAPAESPPVVTALGAGVFKQIANFMAIPAAPGWVLVAKGGAGILGLNLWVTGHSVIAAAIANGFGWACMLAVVWAGLWVRGRLLGWRRRGGVSTSAAGARGEGAASGASTAQDGGRSAAGDAPSEAGVDLGRRRLLLNGAFAGVGLAGTGSVAYGSTVEPWDLRMARYQVPIKDLPASLEGFKIVQVTDTHLGPRVPKEHVKRAMEMALAAMPGVLVLTGDYVHNGFYQIAPAVELFSRYMYSYIPVVGVLGNHDWYAGGKVMSAALTQLGVRMVDNGRVYYDAASRKLTEEPTSECLCIAGVGDLQEDRVDFGAALDGVPEGVARIVLAHNPDSAEHPGIVGASGRHRRIDLMLSGHTHGGQVNLPVIGRPIVPSRYGSKYAHGLNEGPVCRVLTSAGVGLSLVPLRIGVPPEVVEVVLVRG